MKVFAPKFPPITPVKAFPKFECNIYSDIDFQSAISVSSTGNSLSFTELTDRLAFLNFSSPAWRADHEIFIHDSLRRHELIFRDLPSNNMC